ncbi:MAG: DUF5916 domain-containing protein [Bacteroidota bacterium]
MPNDYKELGRMFTFVAMKNWTVLFCFFLCIWFSLSPAQEATQDTSRRYIEVIPDTNVLVRKIQGDIHIDGSLDEAAWQTGNPAEAFWQYFPKDTVLGQGQTDIFMIYDEDFLYVGVICRSLDSGKYVTPSLRRDYNFSGNDNISILFDTFNDQNNAFLFGMNAYGVRREALIANGGRQRGDFVDSWDNKWFGEVQVYEGYWVAEFAIPFKTIRYQEGGKRWRFNCYRFDTKFNEITTWARIPQNQIIMDLAYMGDMIWEEPLPKSGKNISIIPYMIGNGSRDFTDNTQAKTAFGGNIGGDAKIGLTAGLNLDLTVNPDFSQVEVDRQVTNLERFEIFFPERRQFFLENADLFGSFGNRRINPFFSRRIGVARDTATGQNIQNPIHFGARLSGKVNETLRVGLLNMQTASEPENGLPAFNYTVAAAQQRIFQRSNLSFILVNKQAYQPDKFGGEFNSYNRIMGAEYRINTPDNTWTGKLSYHRAFTPTDDRHKFFHEASIEYLQYRYRLEYAQIFIGNGFNAEVGFVPRKDIFLVSPEAEVFFYPKSGILNRHSLTADFRMIYNVGQNESPVLAPWGLADRELQLDWEIQFRDNSRGGLSMFSAYTFLLNDFDPTRVQADSVFLAAGTPFSYTYFRGQFRSNSADKFSISASPTIGQFYSGFRAGMTGSFTYRYQPLGFVSLAYTYNHVRLDAPFVPSNLWLVGPRIDLTFTKNLFLTTFIQYNNQFDNLNINARLQWRFKPVSDFFLVYTDNYFIDPFSQFSVRNRAIVAKLTYWLNV